MSRVRRSGWAGFTLIELLVVIAIASIFTSVVVLSLSGWRSENAPEFQLDRVARLVEQQCEQALLQARPRGVRVTASGVDGWHQTRQGWQLDTSMGAAQAWPSSTHPRLWLDGFPVALDSASNPQIICHPLGELSDFVLDLGPSEPGLRLSSLPAGGVRRHWIEP